MGWPTSRADRWADGGGEWLCALLAGAAREMGAMKGFKGTKTPPWRERGGVKGVGKAGNGPDATKGSGTGYGSRGKQRREEWVCTICETPNFLDKNKCRLCGKQAAWLASDGNLRVLVQDLAPHAEALATRPAYREWLAISPPRAGRIRTFPVILLR